MKIGFTIGKFAPLHKGHQYLIEKGLKEMDKFYVVIYETSVTDISLGKRASWIQQIYPEVNLIYAKNPPSQYGLDEESIKIQNDYLKELVKEIKVIDENLDLITLKNEELNFAYRDSLLKHNKNYICVSATLELENGNTEESLELIEERRQRRLATQPLEYPSAGSVFRNPENISAGKLIEDCGLKGYNINGAEVSTKHANFIINKNNCTGKDIIELIDIIRKKVYDEYNIELVLEQEII